MHPPCVAETTSPGERMGQPARPPRMSQEERRRLSTEKLIDACVELASEHGAGAITFDMIGEKAGYSRNLAFQKFGSKAGLLEAVINHLHDYVEAARERIDHDGMSGLEGIVAFCEAHFIALRRGNAIRAYSILQAAAIGELSDTLNLFESANLRTGRTIRKLLREGIEDGSVRPDIDVEQATLIIGTQLLGISSEAIVEPRFNLNKVLAELRRVVIIAYGTPRSQKLLLGKAKG